MEIELPLVPAITAFRIPRFRIRAVEFGAHRDGDAHMALIGLDVTENDVVVRLAEYSVSQMGLARADIVADIGISHASVNPGEDADRAVEALGGHCGLQGGQMRVVHRDQAALHYRDLIPFRAEEGGAAGQHAPAQIKIAPVIQDVDLSR